MELGYVDEAHQNGAVIMNGRFSLQKELGRSPAFPIYQIAGIAAGCSHKLTKPRSMKGRLLLGGNVCDRSLDNGDIKIMKLIDVAEAATEHDVLWLPLYASSNTNSVFEPLPYLEDFEERLELLADVAPRVKAILIGNTGAELCFWATPGKNSEMIQFVEQHSALVKAAGGRPAFGPTPMELTKDCFGDSKLQAAIIAVAALTICLCGYKLVPEAYIDRSIAEHESFLDQYKAQDQDRIREYVRRSEMWSGVHFMEGLRQDNDKLLAEFGFRAGVLGADE